MLYKTNNPETIRCLVGEDITKEFIAFCKVPAITLENVLADDISDEDITILNIAEKHATVMNLSQVDEENVEKVREFITKFWKEFTSLFDQLWSGNNENRLEMIAVMKLENYKNY